VRQHQSWTRSAWMATWTMILWSLVPAALGRCQEDTKGAGPWQKMLVDKSMEGWKSTQFGGDGQIGFTEEGHLSLDVGDPLTGITYEKDFPKSNFEVTWEANRKSGSDFLAGLTFPVGDEHASFICGGWGGGLIGISSIDGNDASENSTASYKDIKNDRWYRFRLVVSDEAIMVWMDDEELIQVERKGKSFSVRGEVRASRPFGYCVFRSKVEVRNLQYRTLAPTKP